MSGQPTRCQNQAVMLLVQQVFSAQITRLSASTVLVQRLHFPRLQLWYGLPALVQGQLRKEQEAATKQKQQRSMWASIIFGCLLPPHLAGGALVADEEWLARIVCFVRSMCSSWRPVASAALAVPWATGRSSSSRSMLF